MAIDIKKCKEDLKNMFVCTFGYYEAEDEMLQRCIEAIERKDMSVLNNELVVFCAGELKEVKMDRIQVRRILCRYGIWQYVKQKIEENN